MKPEFASTPKLGFGCMRLPLTDPDDQKSIDIEHFKRMVDAFIEGGGTYFDTAFVYHEGASETALRRAGHDVVELEGSYAGWSQWTAQQHDLATTGEDAR